MRRVVNTKPWPLYLRERPGAHCLEGWMSLRAGCGKSRPPRFDPRTVQPVAIAIPTAHASSTYNHKTGYSFSTTEMLNVVSKQSALTVVGFED
jgi:hypothetical protein